MSVLRSAFLVLVGLVFGLFASAAPKAVPTQDATIILVHGAFADGSSWNQVIPILQAKGYKVVAVQNPLTSLADDVAVTQRAIDAATGPVVLVGHSWGGMVITQAGADPKVKALVYVSAFAPTENQAVMDLGTNLAPSPGLVGLAPDSAGFMTLSESSVMQNFAQDLPAVTTKVMFATQGAWGAKGLSEKVTVAGWKGKADYYIVAKQDRMIQPDLEREFAKNMNATTTELNSSHVPMLSQPKKVANVILTAATEIQE